MARNISARMNFLVKFGILPAEAFDFVFPHGPRFSTATKEYAIAGVIRDIALALPDKALQKKLMSAGRSMAEFASKGLVAGWEEGDDICPPYFRHFPWPVPPSPDPDPYPWLLARQEGLTEYGNALKVIAGMAKTPNVAKQLNDIAASLTRQDAGLVLHEN